MIKTEQAQSVFIAGLKNAHAMEKQALSIMQPQINRLEHYPALLRRLEEHAAETETQVERIEKILKSLRESSSTLKDVSLSAMGSMAALGHIPASDEVLKNSFANLAFENYEIAAYISLLTAGRAAGMGEDLSLLEQSLEEEKRMAGWVAENIPAVTRAFITLKSSGEKAGR